MDQHPDENQRLGIQLALIALVFCLGYFLGTFAERCVGGPP